MILSRRRFVRFLVRISGLQAAMRLGVLTAPRRAQASALQPVPITPERFRQALARETGGAELEPGGGVLLDIPSTAEDGAIVPVSLESRLPDTDRISLFVEKNPFPLIAAFDFAARAEPFVSLRIKMNESSAVIAIARAKGRYYRTSQWVRVVRGGCG